jgi:two-component system LytT family response regulator
MFEIEQDYNVDKMIDVVVVDDDVISLKVLEKELKDLFPCMNIVRLCSTFSDGLKSICEIKPQIIFLDIMLDMGTGFDLVEKISYSNKKIIYITSHDKYLQSAFNYKASDFILKPIRRADVYTAINKVLNDLKNEFVISKLNDQLLANKIRSVPRFNEEFDFIAIPTNDKIDFIKTANILYLKSDGRYTTFFLNDRSKIVSAKNIGKYEKILNIESGFFRIHNSFLVNLNKVICINKKGGNYCLMINNDSIPIAKRKLLSLSSFLGLK